MDLSPFEAIQGQLFCIVRSKSGQKVVKTRSKMTTLALRLQMAMRMVYQKAVCLYLLVYIHVNSLILILFVLRPIKRDPFITHLLVYTTTKNRTVTVKSV